MKNRQLARIFEEWLPNAQFNEVHAIEIQDGNPSVILDAVSNLNDSDEPFVRLALKIREAPSRIWGAVGGHSNLMGRKRFGLHYFTSLERTENSLAFGLAGQLWHLDFGLSQLKNSNDITSLNASNTPKLMMVYIVEAGENGLQQLVTQTSVFCPDKKNLIYSAPY